MIGGGKFGTNFLRYAKRNKFPFVLVIDKDENTPASREAKVLKIDYVYSRARISVFINSSISFL